MPTIATPAQPPELQVRTEKLNFISEELALAMDLATACPDDFLKRCIARHVLIRAEDFIAHARALRRPLNLAGFDTKSFHEKKEILATEYDEYFALTRSKLGGHVQDMDFLARIEAWNDVEVSKASFFVDGAREVVRDLVSLGAASRAGELRREVELQTLKSRLSGVGATSDPEAYHLGSDSLALARPNTGTVLNSTPVHQRAAQISLLQRWISDEFDVLHRLADLPGYRRILVARIVTDVVSFIDALTTRTDAGPRQAMLGLDDLLRQLPWDPWLIDALKAKYRLEPKLQSLRLVRNRMGAHVELDPRVTMRTLLHEIDDVDIPSLSRFYAKLDACFRRTCYDSVILSSYPQDREPLPGVIGSSRASEYIIPFDATIRPVQPSPVRTSTSDPLDDDQLRAHLGQWLEGGAEAEEGLDAFRSAFAWPQPVEAVLWSRSGGGTVTRPVELSLAHQILLDELESTQDTGRAVRILELICGCARGFPEPLTEIVLRYWSFPGRIVPDAAIARTLAETADWETVESTFAEMFDNGGVGQRIEAIIAMFRVFLRDEGIARSNGKPARHIFEPRIAPRLMQLPVKHRLGALLALAARATWETFASDSCSSERDWIHGRLREDAATLGSNEATFSDSMEAFIRLRDFVGASVLIGDAIQTRRGDAGEDDAKWFYGLAPRGLILQARHPGGMASLAVALCRDGRRDAAVQVAKQTFDQNPHEPEYGLLTAELLAEAGLIGECVAQLDELADCYDLTVVQHERLSRLRAAAEGAQQLVPDPH